MKCPICLHEFLEDTLQSHHITPIEYGGLEEGPTVRLCSNDHLKCHYTAENLTAKNAKRRHFFTNPDELERARPYIQAIIVSKIISRDLPKTNARNLVILELDAKRKSLLQRLKQLSGHTSINKYIISLIDKELRSKGII